MKIVVAGLGIIGGSMAKALSKYTDHHICGVNRSPQPLRAALACGAVDEIGSTDSLADADVLILGIYPEAAVQFVRENAGKIRKGCIVADTSGIKSSIFPALEALAKENGFKLKKMHFAGTDSTIFQLSITIIIEFIYFACEDDFVCH